MNDMCRSRSSSPDVFCKKGVLRNIAKFTGKHLCQSLYFNKAAGLRSTTLLKKKLWHSCFPVNFAKFLITLFTVEDPYWLLLVLFISLKLFIIVDITIDIITHFNLEKGFAFQ